MHKHTIKQRGDAHDGLRHYTNQSFDRILSASKDYHNVLARAFVSFNIGMYISMLVYGRTFSP